jgi:hypothetical protein
MKPGIQKRFAFICKSMLWSVMLYVTMMLVFNWDEVNNAIKGNKGITIVTNTLPGVDPSGTAEGKQANISGHVKVFTAIVSIVKTVTGFTVKSNR